TVRDSWSLCPGEAKRAHRCEPGASLIRFWITIAHMVPRVCRLSAGSYWALRVVQGVQQASSMQRLAAVLGLLGMVGAIGACSASSDGSATGEANATSSLALHAEASPLKDFAYDTGL